MAWFRRRNALTAAAQIKQGPDAPSPDSKTRTVGVAATTWQKEVWDFYDQLGEFRQGVTWKSNMMSRVRLRAAKVVDTDDEPQIVTTGPAHDAVRKLAGGIGGRSTMMRSFEIHLSVPGECWLVGEQVNPKIIKWYTRSLEEVRQRADKPGMYAVKDGSAWRNLPDASIVVRVYRPHERWHDLADSPARAARPTLRELELVNRHIQAQYISRLASAGIVLFPEEVTFPVRPEFMDAPDPFVAEWIEVAAEAIRTPGTAASVIPIPLKVPGEMVDKIKLIDFTLKIDEKVIEKRAQALGRLAIELDMPAEALLGTGQVNHWGAWLIDEQGVKIHIAPDAEVICDALTIGYLHPMLKAMGETDVEQWVVWYDASELVLRPDNSKNATDAYDRLEINGEAYRREIGFSETDVPDDDELRTMILKKASLQPVNTFAALDELGLETEHDTPLTAPRPVPNEPPGSNPADERNPPPPEKAPPAQAASLKQQLLRQARLMHAVKIDLDGWSLLHPTDCEEHLFSCPVTHATWKPVVGALPGTSGMYYVWLNAHGTPIMGERIYNGDAENMIDTKKRPRAVMKI